MYSNRQNTQKKIKSPRNSLHVSCDFANLPNYSSLFNNARVFCRYDSESAEELLKKHSRGLTDVKEPKILSVYPRSNCTLHRHIPLPGPNRLRTIPRAPTGANL